MTDLPADLLSAVSHAGGGRVVLVVGAGCSIEPPTSLPMGNACAIEAHRRLLADGILAKDDCGNPEDLSCVADAVFNKTDSQRALVDRLPIEEFRLAAPNAGYELAAALLREKAVICVLTLNFDLALKTALSVVGARTDVAVIGGPEQFERLGVTNVIYLHRNVECGDPEKQAGDDLRALAQVALRHLGVQCPVCTQTYDREGTRRRLERLASSQTEQGEDPAALDVIEQARALATAEGKLASLEARFREAATVAERIRAWESEMVRRLGEVGLSGDLDGSSPRLEKLIADLGELSNALEAHFGAGEQLAISLAQAAEEARRTDVEKDLADARREASLIEDDVKARQNTGELAAKLLEALRDASSDVVADRVSAIVPLLQKIYARVDPHPAFRAVGFLTRMSRGRGRMVTRIDDSLESKSSETPEAVLSSSQMNALAVSVFLTLNLGIAMPIQVAILDDPLQSLDDVNLLGLIDLLRRAKDKRQLFISTHDRRFGKLLELKLRPVNREQRTRIIELGDWTRAGPIVDQRDAPKDSVTLRIAV